MARPFWRKGHNREARRLIFRYVFEELAADEIETECWSENLNSLRSILAHGFEVVGQVDEYNRKHGRVMQKTMFRMTREGWRGCGEADGG